VCGCAAHTGVDEVDDSSDVGSAYRDRRRRRSDARCTRNFLRRPAIPKVATLTANLFRQFFYTFAILLAYSLLSTRRVCIIVHQKRT